MVCYLLFFYIKLRSFVDYNLPLSVSELSDGAVVNIERIGSRSGDHHHYRDCWDKTATRGIQSQLSCIEGGIQSGFKVRKERFACIGQTTNDTSIFPHPDHNAW